MRTKYLNACIQEKLEPEKIREIERVLDASKKKGKRQSESAERNGLIVMSFSSKCTDEEGNEYDIEDKSVNIERDFCNRADLEILKKVLEELSENEKKFIMTYYGPARENASELARMFGIPKTTGFERLQSLLKKIKTRFFELSSEESTDIFK